MSDRVLPFDEHVFTTLTSDEHMFHSIEAEIA